MELRHAAVLTHFAVPAPRSGQNGQLSRGSGSSSSSSKSAASTSSGCEEALARKTVVVYPGPECVSRREPTVSTKVSKEPHQLDRLEQPSKCDSIYQPHVHTCTSPVKPLAPPPFLFPPFAYSFSKQKKQKPGRYPGNQMSKPGRT
eukprot:275734-Pelagomonas_calceolata.AAC.2